MQLNDLAKKVGISSSALSQIENGKAFPSIVHLKSIADCLYTTVGEVIGEHETLIKNPLLKNSQKKLVHKNKTGAKSYLLSHHDSHKQMETYSIVFIVAGIPFLSLLKSIIRYFFLWPPPM